VKKFIVALAPTGLDGAKRKKLLAAAVACLLSTAAHSATFLDVSGYTDTINIVGEIKEGDDMRLNAKVLEHHQAGFPVKYVMLNSEGGLLLPAYNMAMMLRVLNASTMVPAKAYCVSACMVVLAGGAERMVTTDSYLGVHSASLGTSESSEGTLVMIRFMKELGVPANVLGLIAATENADITWLKASDGRGWLTSVPLRDTPPTPELPPQPYPPSTQPYPPSTPTARASNNNFMTCQSTTTRDTYIVTWSGGKTIQVGKRTFDVASTRPGNEDPNQTVVSGRTLVKNGKFAAVLGGTNPKMFFWTPKEKAEDRCW
jgi:hypothetical protein